MITIYIGIAFGGIGVGVILGAMLTLRNYRKSPADKEEIISLLRDCAQETWMATDSKKLEELLDEFLVKKKLK